MQSLKTYINVNKSDDSVSFEISRMEDVYHRRQGKVDEPHRHNFYTVLIIKEASGEHKIDFNSYEMGKNQVFFVSPGQVHQVIEKSASKGFALLFSNQFLVQNSIQLSFVESLNLFRNYDHSPPLEPNNDQFSKLEGFASAMFDLFHSNIEMKHLSIGAYLKLLLIECNNICSVNPIDNNSDTTGNHIIRDFKKMVEQQYQKEHSTAFYAQELHITADHLTRVFKNAIGYSPKEYIQARIITAAKRLLYFTDLSNKEIGFELGFSEPANFSAFFKKQTGLSPSSFKEGELLATPK